MRKRLTLLLILALLVVSQSAGLAALAEAPALAYDDPNVPVINIMTRDVSESQVRRNASGFDDDDNPYARYVFEKTGIRVNLLRQPDNEYDAKVQLTLAANDGSVDYMFLGYSSNILPIAQSGALLPLNDYLDAEKYPNLMAVYNDEYWNTISFSEDRLLVANMNVRLAKWSTLIRKDWLDAAGLAVPTTVQELYEAAKAFVELKGDGNDPTFALSGRKNLSNLIIGLTAAYGNPHFNPHYPYHYLDKEQKQIVSWNTSDAARAFYTEIQKWWKEGLVNKESLVNEGASWWDEIYTGLFGIISHQTVSVGWLTSEIRTTQQKAEPELAVVPPLSGSGFTNQYGNNLLMSPDAYDGYYGVPRSAKNVENVLTYLDWLCTVEGMEYNMYGLEGIEHDVVDGKKVLTKARSSEVGFSEDYVFTRGNPALVTPQMWEDYIIDMAGNAETDFDTTEASVARVRAAVEFDNTLDRPPFENWMYTVPKVDAESMYADYQSEMTRLWVLMIQGEYDASTDEGWAAYLQEVENTGYLKVLEEKTQWILENNPALFE